MVYYSQTAKEDLDSIFDGLLSWPKHDLEYNHVIEYHNDLKEICDSLDGISFHFEAKNISHRQFGQKVYKYVRNKSTTWYIIYNLDLQSNSIFIEHITSNHITVE